MTIALILLLLANSILHIQEVVLTPILWTGVIYPAGLSPCHTNYRILKIFSNSAHYLILAAIRMCLLSHFDPDTESLGF